MRLSIAPVVGLASLALVACSTATADLPIGPTGEPVHQYVVDGIDVPNSVIEANALGFDLDGDSAASPDNHLGMVLSQLFVSDFGDIDDIVGAQIDSGSILHLVEVETGSLESSGRVGTSMYIGVDDDHDSSDNFTGSEVFSIDFDASIVDRLGGHINNGELAVGPGTVSVKLALPGMEDTFVVHLIGAQLDGAIDAEGLSGRVGGAVTKAEVDSVLMPLILVSIERAVSIDCVGTDCESGSNGAFFLDLLDTNHDGAVTQNELETNPLIEVLAAPDVDLLDADGDFNPGVDGVKDSLSLGIGFTAVTARF